MIEKWEVVDLGIDSPDYFQGFGVAFTEFDFCCYGMGDDPREALDDALESLAQQVESADIDALETAILAQFPEFADDRLNAQAAKLCGDDQYYHIGIRWS